VYGLHWREEGARIEEVIDIVGIGDYRGRLAG